MFRISKLTDYALILLTYISKNPKELYQASKLSTQTSIGKATVSKLLKRLTKHKLLHSIRGVKGGYTLIKSPQQITLLDIIQIIDGPIALTECSLNEKSCDISQNCNLKKPWLKINTIISKTFQNYKLCDLVPANDNYCHCQFSLKFHNTDNLIIKTKIIKNLQGEKSCE